MNSTALSNPSLRDYGSVPLDSTSPSVSIGTRLFRFFRSPFVVLSLWGCFLLWFCLVNTLSLFSSSSSSTSASSAPSAATDPSALDFASLSMLDPSIDRMCESEKSKIQFFIHYQMHLLKASNVTGRMMVCLAQKEYSTKEPRFVINDSPTSQQMFGMDVTNLHSLENVVMDLSVAQGYPRLFLSEIPTGEYWLQAVFRPYEEFNRSDGKSIWLPPFHTFEADHGVMDAEGTLYSSPVLVSLSAAKEAPLQNVTLILDHIMPPLRPLESVNRYLQHVKFRSAQLSTFWGVEVYLQAWVLLPGGFYDHPDVHYPIFMYHSHYSRDFEFDYTDQHAWDNATLQEQQTDTSLREGYHFYQNWTSEHGTFHQKRGIIVQLQHANPYYDDSYGVNSENIGPYGDAITYEFIPYVEKKYRGIGEGWARTLYGGSTGGWESFAIQVLYPEEYNGCWAFCPDSLDFHHVQLVNLYEGTNAYYSDNTWARHEKPARRNELGEIQQTMVEENYHELARGSRGRSGGQWDVWQAVYGPKGKNGYPSAIWDKVTGKIDPKIAEHWISNFDLRYYLQNNWNVTGHQLVNKLHIYVGLADSYYLNDAVYLMDHFLQSTTNPYYNGTVAYGAAGGKGFGHCWTGAYNTTMLKQWDSLNYRMIPQFIDHIVSSAPKDADLSFTSY